MDMAGRGAGDNPCFPWMRKQNREQKGPFFRDLEDKGVSILAGKLCVADLGLLDKIAIGKLTTMDEILDLILHHSVISL